MVKDQLSPAPRSDVVLMDEIEHIKENIMPLDTGWDPVALRNSVNNGPEGEGELRSPAPTKEELMNSKDPLGLYYDYLRHLRQLRPNGHPDFLAWLEKAVRAFRKDPRYKNDRRYLWMWMSVAGRSMEPRDVFKYLSVNEIGTKLPTYYEQYAKYLETISRNEEAREALLLGIHRNVDPSRLRRRLEELECRMNDQEKSPQDSEDSEDLRTTSPLSNANSSVQTQASKVKVYVELLEKPGGSQSLAPSTRPASVWGEFGSVLPRQKENINTSQRWDGNSLAQKGLLIDQDAPPLIPVYIDDTAEDDGSSSLSAKQTLEKTRVLREKTLERGVSFRSDSQCRLPASGAKKDRPHRIAVLNARYGYSSYTVIFGKRVYHEVSFEEMRAKWFMSPQQNAKRIHFSGGEPGSEKALPGDRMFDLGRCAKGASDVGKRHADGKENDCVLGRELYNDGGVPLDNSDNSLRYMRKCTNDSSFLETPESTTLAERLNSGSDEYPPSANHQSPPNPQKTAAFPDIYKDLTQCSSIFQSEITLNEPQSYPDILPRKLVDAMSPRLLEITSTPPKALPGFFLKKDTHFDIKDLLHSKSSSSECVPSHLPSCFWDMKIIKEVGRGGYGRVYLAELPSDSEAIKTSVISVKDTYGDTSVALKVTSGQTPWEYVLLSRLHSRLEPECAERIIRPLSCFMFENETCMLMDYFGNDTLLDRANKAHNTSGNLVPGFDESLIAYWTVEMIRTVEAVHAAGVIHRDIKPDNFLLRLNIGDAPKHQGAPKRPAKVDHIFRADGSGGWKHNGLVLIDWGSAIDLEMFDPDARFYESDRAKGGGGEPSVECWDARNGVPYRYECDWYGVAGTIYVLMFGKYMQVRENKDPDDIYGRPDIEIAGCSFKRYWQTSIWKRLFHILLNSGKLNSIAEKKAAEGKPREKFSLIKEIRELRQQLEEWLYQGSCRDGRGIYGFLKRLNCS